MFSPIAAKIRHILLATLVSGGVQYVQVLLLAHFLGPEAFGLITVVYLTYTFAALFVDCGLGAALISFQLCDRDSLSTLFWLNIAAGGAIAASLPAAAPLLAAHFDSDRLLGLLRLMALCPFLLAFSSQYLALLQKEMRFGTIAAAEITGKAVGLIVFLIRIISTKDLSAPIWALVADTAIRSAILLIAGQRILPLRPVFKLEILRRLASYGAFHLGDRITNFFAGRADRILIGALLTPEDLGYYAFAYTLVSQPYLRISPVLSRLSMPLFARVQESQQVLKRTYLNLLDLLLTLSVPLLIGITFLAPLYVPLFFGDTWAPAIPLIFVLCIAMILMVHSSPSGTLLVATGKTGRSFALTSLYFVAQVPAATIGAKFLGPLGVAGSIAVLQLAYIGIEYRLIFHAVLGRSFAAVYGLLLPALLASLPFIAVMILLLNTGWICNPITRLVVGIAAFIVSFGLTILWRRKASLTAHLEHLSHIMTEGK